ncbi:MAG: class I SAM-dependent methyltransferase [Chitinophagaceae bacterium]
MTEDEKFKMFENRLLKVNRHISRQAKTHGITCYRIYDHDLPDFPFCIEKYQDKIYLAEYKRRHGMTDEEHFRWLGSCKLLIQKMLNISEKDIFIKERKRKSSRLEQYEKISSEEQRLIVIENGLKFQINLSDYLDTGLFLDHRITRGMFREEAKGKRVLNLFCYTGSFSVYAAAGKAKEIVSVDLSNTYLRWAKENMALNHLLDENSQQYIRADVKKWLPNLPKEHFDLIIMDPPTFSNSKGMKDLLDIQRDHVELLNQLLRGTSAGGIIYFSTNLRTFILEKDQIPATQIRDITPNTIPFDFKGKLQRWCYRIIK